MMKKFKEFKLKHPLTTLHKNRIRKRKEPNPKKKFYNFKVTKYITKKLAYFLEENNLSETGMVSEKSEWDGKVKEKKRVLSSLTAHFQLLGVTANGGQTLIIRLMKSGNVEVDNQLDKFQSALATVFNKNILPPIVQKQFVEYHVLFREPKRKHIVIRGDN